MDKKTLWMLTIITAVVLNITTGNCYATNQSNSTSSPPPPSAPTQNSSTNNTTTAAQNAQNTNTVDKLFDQAGYQYFQINKDIDSDEKYPKLFDIPDGNDNEDDN